MPEYGLCMACFFPYMERTFDFVLIWENTDQRKPVCWHIFYSVFLQSNLTFEIYITYIYIYNMVPVLQILPETSQNSVENHKVDINYMLAFCASRDSLKNFFVNS